MTDAELSQWLGYHDAAFVGFRSWVNKTEHGTDQTLKDRIALWSERVRKIPRDVATAATEKMFADGIDLPFGKHLGWVCDYAARAARAAEPRERFSSICQLCNNTGIVSVKFHYDRKTFGGNPLPDNVGQAACKCSEGKRVNEGRAANPIGSKLEWFTDIGMDVHHYEAKAGRYEVSESHRKAGRLQLAKLIEEFGYVPQDTNNER